MSIEVKNITKIYGKQKALNNISFNVKQGEIVGFLGPNGAGKSTTMKIITCFIPPSQGEISVCGLDVIENAIEVRKKVGYLPENNPLYLDMYVKEYLHFVAGLYHIKNKNQRVSEMIDLVGLGLEQNKQIGQLSKGYRQRVGLAQAMIHSPEVLILDEPTSGLDPNQLSEIRNVIKAIGKEKTVMLSTHIMQEVEAICDRVIIINQGDIVADDQAVNLRKYNEEQAVIIVEFDKKVDKKALKQIEGVEDAVETGEKIWRISAKGDKDVRNTIFSFAVKNNISVLTMQRETESMEAVFKKLTTTKK